MINDIKKQLPLIILTTIILLILVIFNIYYYKKPEKKPIKSVSVKQKTIEEEPNDLPLKEDINENQEIKLENELQMNNQQEKENMVTTLFNYNSSENVETFINCSYYKSKSKTLLEKKCDLMNEEDCSNSDCCIFLNGEKCKAGNINGPIFKNINENKKFDKNVDFYYFNNECYGKCN